MNLNLTTGVPLLGVPATVTGVGDLTVTAPMITVDMETIDMVEVEDIIDS